MLQEAVTKYRKKIEVLNSPLLFFGNCVDLVLPKEDEDIKFHLAQNVLTRLSKCDELYAEGRYMSALEQKAKTVDESKRYFTYLHIGDYCLFISGLFPKSLQRPRRGLDKEYFRHFGEKGYSQAASCRTARKAHMSDTLEDLSKNFPDYCLALNEIAEVFTQEGRDKMGEAMLDEFGNYKKTGNVELLEKARKRAKVLGVTSDSFPSLFQ